MTYLHETLERLKKSSPAQAEFYQAAEELLESVEPLLEAEPRYLEHGIIERLVEPERQILFRVTWTDDEGRIRVNKGYRVQFNSALGPYKGGLRFHPSVNAGIIKFLGFEQIFKNALTGLSLGAGKGGSDFNPRGRSAGEVMRFCQSFMTELARHIGPRIDVPAGDIGVGGRELGWMFGQYRRLTRRFEGALTGKGMEWGGSFCRTQATGYGAVYFAETMLRSRGESLKGCRCLVSGAGNVAIHAIEKLIQVGARPVSCSDSTGALYHADGIDLTTLRRIKLEERGSLKGYLEEHTDAEFTPVDDYPAEGHAVWRYPADAAFPCATQNELCDADAKALLDSGISCVAEGANMPSTAEAVDRFVRSGIAFGPAKAANAGGVATSQLEMQQNATLQQWTTTKVDRRLQQIMIQIHKRASDAASEFGQPGNLVLGANIAAFRRVADAMIDQGAI
ncbi:MAG: NADP-specific glutamate dehydrogenase [Chromatiales bacterium]|nr:NADP-specific glutamate dehydrogenase [Chromatiales bacterium]